MKTLASEGLVKDQIWPTYPYTDPYLYKHFKITNNMITYVEQMGIQANENLHSKWIWSISKFSIIFQPDAYRLESFSSVRIFKLKYFCICSFEKKTIKFVYKNKLEGQKELCYKVMMVHGGRWITPSITMTRGKSRGHAILLKSFIYICLLRFFISNLVE